MTATFLNPIAGSIPIAGFAPNIAQSTSYYPHPTPDVWLKTVISEVMAVPLTDEFVWAAEGLTLDVYRQSGCLRGIVPPESYPTVKAEELYFVASELVP